MSDQFDKKLVKKINEVFDNFEDGSANESWMELRKQFPEKASKPGTAIWWVSSAAAILLLCSVWFLTNEKKPEETKIVKSSPLENTAGPTLLPDTISGDSSLTENPIASLEPDYLATKKLRNVKTRSNQDQDMIYDSAQQSPPEKESMSENSQHDLTLMALTPNPGKTEKPELASNAISPSDSSKTESSTGTWVDKSGGITDIYPSEVISKEQLSNLIRVDKKDKKKDKPLSGKILSLDIFAGSYFNYAEGSRTNINTGFGLTSDLKISKKLKISTGVSLGQNSLKYNQLIPRKAALSFASSHDAIPLNLSNKQGITSLNPISYSINSYDAKLLGLDIPVNLKYTLLEKKNTFYLSTGFSSNFFIDESYTYTFNYQTNNSKEPTLQSSSKFQSFDFAKVLNFSMGLDHRINNQTKLTLEPFVKYPLSGLGANDLRFGAAGMNLKLNFNRSK